MTQATTYKFSERALLRVKRRILTIELLMPVMLVVFVFASPLTSTVSLGIMIGVAIFCLVLFEAIMIIGLSISIRKMKELAITVSTDMIERTGGKFAEKIPYKDIQQVDIYECPSGEISHINVKLVTKRTIALSGFENMELVAQNIKDIIPEKSLIRRKKQNIDWDNPALILIISSLSLAAILLIQGLGDTIYLIFDAVFFFVFGLFNLTYKPLTRSWGKRIEKYEVISSVFLVTCSIALGILLLIFR